MDYLPLHGLKPNPANPKSHDVAAIAASIVEHEFADFPVIDERTGFLIAGHGRREALLKLFAADPKTPPPGIRTSKADWMVPVARGWASPSDGAAKAMLVKDNIIGELGGWDDAALLAVLRDPVALDGLADFYDADEIENYDPAWRANLPGGSRSAGKVKNDDVVDWTPALKLFTGPVVYEWCAYSIKTGSALEAMGFDLRSQIVWAKPTHALSRGDYHWQHEVCWYGVRKGATSNWNGDRSQTTVWNIATVNFSKDKVADERSSHGTQKPVECMERPMRNSSKRGDAIYDPFVGSGTTIIAAEKSGRRARCIDVDPAYVQLAKERWERFTGKKAVRAIAT